jgi:predicted nuclease with TOPRIM domain
MKKLVNDTHSQRQNFEKEILIAYAKIKEEMFMDYPKFNALVKAKEYEYCEIIKAQKTEIAVLKEKLNEISGGHEHLVEEHKQLQYEYARTTNELKNKEATLAETTDKLNIMAQKYNEQAKEAILKAR